MVGCIQKMPSIQSLHNDMKNDKTLDDVINLEFDTLGIVNNINASVRDKFSTEKRIVLNTFKQIDKKEKLRERLRIKLEAKK